MLQNATLLRKSAPGPPNISDEHVSRIALATGNLSLQILFKCPTLAIVFWKTHKTLTFCSLLTRCIIPCACHAKSHLNVQKCSVPLSFLHFWLGNVLPATTTRTFSTSQLPKVVPALCVLCIFTWTCASHHFDLEMCFAPQRRALFRHLNFQVVRTSGALHFDLEMSFTPQRRALFRHLTSKSVPNLVCFCTF